MQLQFLRHTMTSRFHSIGASCTHTGILRSQCIRWQVQQCALTACAVCTRVRCLYCVATSAARQQHQLLLNDVVSALQQQKHYCSGGEDNIARPKIGHITGIRVNPVTPHNVRMKVFSRRTFELLFLDHRIIFTMLIFFFFIPS